MKIVEGRFFRFALPLKQRMKFKEIETHQREGILIHLAADDGTTSWGEISPLPGFSTETFQQALSQVQDTVAQLFDQTVPENLPELRGGFDEWLGAYDLYPSVRHGIETAALALLANSRDISMARLLTESPPTTFRINGLLTGDANEVAEKARQMQRDGYRAVKLKVGRLPLADDIERVKNVFYELDSRCVLRLDANRAWHVAQAEEFFEAVKDCRIEYIEDPVESMDGIHQLLNRGYETIAIDEFLASLQPDDLHHLRDLAAIVVKPMLVGGFERTARLARVAREHKTKVVISSAFDSPLGIAALGPLVTAYGTPGVPVGLETVNWFADDFLGESIAITNGVMRVEQLARAAVSIDESQLMEIGCD
ncbi:o-succinylbenzoate synthase [candidate division GN15 bacterium]|nr:o-succinylbenzoate synthase [candidate division GN15 bacterium]